ncbi:MAG: ribonuclease HII [Desulfurococcales archaeon]|nr:ribonuclease HII [Desulfurococcales archaeon]
MHGRGRAEDIILGIDEAGRGPVIGDMFMAGVLVRKEAIPQLIKVGVKDSKRLTPSRREKLFPQIIRASQCVVVVRFPPKRIDLEGLTKLFIEGIARILNHVTKEHGCPKEVFVDAVSNPAVKNIISKHLCEGSKLIYEHKADSKYHVVAAASIIAKYLRDKHVEALRSFYGDFGSGYPSDPRTREWLRSMGGKYPPIVRLSWKTLKRISSKGLGRFLGESSVDP